MLDLEVAKPFSKFYCTPNLHHVPCCVTRMEIQEMARSFRAISSYKLVVELREVIPQLQEISDSSGIAIGQ